MKMEAVYTSKTSATCPYPHAVTTQEPRTKFTSTANHCESLQSVTGHFLIQCFQLMGFGFYTQSTFEKEGKKKFLFARFIMLSYVSYFVKYQPTFYKKLRIFQLNILFNTRYDYKV